MSDQELAAEPQSEGRARDIFAIDYRVWQQVLLLGINPAVALVVLARGSGGDQSTTSWSTDAIERYTRISRPRAKEAIEQLEREGFLDLLRSGTKPLRRIRPAHEVPGCEGYRGILDGKEQEFLAKLPIRASVIDRSKRKRRLTDRVRFKGWAEWDGDEEYLVATPPSEHDEAKRQPDWIWLPNALVDGVAEEIPPLELVRQTQCILTLRMLVETYAFQLLPTYGGVDIREVGAPTYDRQLLGECGEYRIFGFRPPAGWYPDDFDPKKVGPLRPFDVSDDRRWSLTQAPAWRHVGCHRLTKLGLLQYVPCVFDGEEGELVWAVGSEDEAAFLSPSELQFGTSARAAARKMLPHRSDEELDGMILVPVPAHMQQAQLKGVFRTRYRPHTSLTAHWVAKSEGLRPLTDRFMQISA